jgi:hypothetical protein
MITGRHPQIGISHRIVYQLDLTKEPVFDVSRDLLRPDIVDEESFEPFIPESSDHARSFNAS